MLLDHIGAVLLPKAPLLRLLGRAAFPLFAFLLVEGALTTRNPRRYLARLAIGAVISELPFDYAVSGGVNWSSQSVMPTLLIGAALLLGAERGKWRDARAAALLATALALLLRCDHGVFGIPLIWLLYQARKSGEPPTNALLIFTAMSAAAATWGSDWPFWLEAGSLLALPLLLRYDPNGPRPGKIGMAMGYLFYPAHLAALALIVRSV